MMKPKLAAVPAAPKEEKARDPRARMTRLRRMLLAAAVRYVRNGPDRTLKTRLREASEISGVPAILIEVEL